MFSRNKCWKDYITLKQTTLCYLNRSFLCFLLDFLLPLLHLCFFPDKTNSCLGLQSTFSPQSAWAASPKICVHTWKARQKLRQLCPILAGKRKSAGNLWAALAAAVVVVTVPAVMTAAIAVTRVSQLSSEATLPSFLCWTVI